ncbi:MAG: HEAT repeat domain-containing protein [Kiritimatiellia bacterium]
MKTHTRILCYSFVVAFSTFLHAEEPRLVPEFGEKGLTSLKVDGAELLANATIRVSLNGKPLQGGSLESNGRNEVVLTWPELKASVLYAGSSSHVAYTFEFENTGEVPIRSLDLQPFDIRFPKRPQGGHWFWGYTHNAGDGAPAVIAGDWGDAKLAVSAYEDTSIRKGGVSNQTVAIELKGPTSRSTIYPVIYKIRFPTPIEPGETATFKGSLRVAPSGTPTPDMAKDVYEAFKQKFPFVLDWPDRRPIGVIFLANSGQNWPTNPRGWFNDPKVDVTTEAGLADFRKRLMELADRSIAIMQDVGAQGMLFWDVEGGEMPHAITYLGDPRALPTHAPEMDAVADEFFQKFIDAGFKTGVTIRPSKIVTRPSTGKPAHQQVDDPIADMSDKIAYAKKRWGATIFYMDTNVTWPIDTRPLEEDLTRGMWQGNASLISSADMVDLAQRHPDTLFFPEFPRFGYYSAVGIYGETKTGGRLETPADVRAVYPDAMTVWKLGDVDFLIEWEGLLQASLDGDVQVFRAWFGDWANAFVKRLQQEKAYVERTEDMSPGAPALQIRDEKPELRYDAVRALNKPGVAETRTLIQALEREKDWVIRRQILLALARSGSPEAIPVLIPLAKDSGPKLDYPAMMALTTIGGEGTKAVLEIAGTASGRQMEYALRALRVNNDPVATPLLAEIAMGENDKLSALAIDALRGRHSPELERAMIGVLDSDQPSRLIAAANLLGAYQSRAAVEPLVDLIQRAVSDLKNNHVRVAAGKALEQITGQRHGPYEYLWKRAFDAGKLTP